VLAAGPARLELYIQKRHRRGLSVSGSASRIRYDAHTLAGAARFPAGARSLPGSSSRSNGSATHSINRSVRGDTCIVEVTSRFSPSPPHRPTRKRWWRRATFLIPTVIALAAAGFTGGTYWDAHRADQRQVEQGNSAAAASREADARLVSFEQSYDLSTLTIQNLAPNSIYNVTVVASVNFGSVPPGEPEHSMLPFQLGIPLPEDVALDLGQLPPCSDIVANLHQSSLIRAALTEIPLVETKPQQQKFDQAARKLEAGRIPWDVFLFYIEFRDARGRYWVLSNQGKLVRPFPQGANPDFNFDITDLSVSSAIGCS
jgi:hypothetical protein